MYAHRPFADFLATARGRAVEKFTGHTVVGLDALATVFSDVRRRGFSTSIRQFNLAQSGAAAPVFDRTGKPHLAVVTLAFSSELGESNIDPVGRLISTTAGRITDRTGGTYSPDVEIDEVAAAPSS